MNLIEQIINNNGKLFKDENKKRFMYLQYDLKTTMNNIEFDWRFYISGILKEKLNKNDVLYTKNKFKYVKKTYLLIKYLNILNSILHSFENIYRVLLKNKLTGKEKNDQKLSMLVNEKIIIKNSNVYFYFKILNIICSAFRNKISHGSILNVALYIVNYLTIYPQPSKDFKEFMEEANNAEFFNGNLCSIEGTNYDYLENNIKYAKIKFYKNLNDVQLNIKINDSEMENYINRLLQKNKDNYIKYSNDYINIKESNIEEKIKNKKINNIQNKKDILKKEKLNFLNVLKLIKNSHLTSEYIVTIIENIIKELNKEEKL